MNKSPDAFRTISEVADWLGTPAHVLRFWESRFSQVKPVKRAGGRRYYRPSDMVLLGGIKKLLHDDGMTIRGVQKLLREHGVRYVASMSPQIDGVDPVTPLSESVGPVPAAPMAENVPTGAFDQVPETPEERIIPFSRPNVPAQSAPNASSPAAPVEAPVEAAPKETERPALDDETAQDVPTAAPAQVTFDFGFDAEPDAVETPTPAPLVDDAAFETALQEALSNPDTAPDTNDGEDGADEKAANPVVQSEVDEDNLEPAQDHSAQVESPFEDDEIVPEPMIDSAPEGEALPAQPPELPNDYANTARDADENDLSSDTFADAPAATDLEINPAETIVQNFEDVAPIEPAEPTSSDAVITDTDTSLSDTDAPQDHIQSVAMEMVPDDLEDDALGLDVADGVLGRLNKDALRQADTKHVQAIFDRAMALKIKLSQAG
ncbi:MerR family transcriptional regulator [Pacificibacter marinus]|uniref:MerR family transcriptional regulator n=1 Tax=Pacificibacter marinus TaxID=658057 RepID=UPI002091E398|nr:MerR family transcriptional regulator [Pacificibacter marinus]